MADCNYIFKFTIIGNSGVGKSALLIQFADQRFQHEHVTTLGVDIINRKINIDGNKIKLQLWDTSGQDKYLSITRSYFRGSAGVLLVYDITDRKSFDQLHDIWLANIQEFCDNSNIVIFLIGNKSDLVDERTVSTQEGEAFVRDNGLDGFLETSAKTASNVEVAFTNLAIEIYNKVDSGVINIDDQLLSYPGVSFMMQNLDTIKLEEVARSMGSNSWRLNTRNLQKPVRNKIDAAVIESTN